MYKNEKAGKYDRDVDFVTTLIYFYIKLGVKLL